MLQVPGAALLNQAASGNIGGALQAIPTLIFSGSLFPEGELKLNGLKDDFAKAMQDRQRGDDQAVNKFFVEHPEYEARLALNDEPEERLRQFLISEVWDRYSSLESANRKAAADPWGTSSVMRSSTKRRPAAMTRYRSDDPCSLVADARRASSRR
jgi:hypothetical protein